MVNLDIEESVLELKIGDVVKLKSGGPKMVIRYFIGDKDQISMCSWIGDDDVDRECSFPNVCLTKDDI